MGVQLAPVLGFVALWQWDRRRRFLEAHPDIVRRRQARRALRREKGKLQKAVAAGNAVAFVEHAANAMKNFLAPHFLAHPRALVCADVLAQLAGPDQTGRTGETVRKIFVAADAQFAATAQLKPIVWRSNPMLKRSFRDWRKNCEPAVFQKRQRTGALQDADAMAVARKIRGASWSAAALRRFLYGAALPRARLPCGGDK